MNIVQEGNKFLKLITSQVPSKLRIMTEFGFKALSLTTFKSLNSNARSVVLNRNTAESKIYRLTSNNKLADTLPYLFSFFFAIEDGDHIIIDFSDFQGFMVLMFAKQTKEGRAIPLYFEIIEYPIKKGSQNLFIIDSIKRFLKIINNKKVIFVMDRGFACPSIIEYLCLNKGYFVIRVKKIKGVIQKNGKFKKVKDLHFKDMEVYAYKNNLRMVRSEKEKGIQEEWYLVTNCFEEEKEEILETYYYRFEIEELFKDSKHLYNLEKIRIKKQRTIKILLYFVIFGFWFMYYLEKKSKEGKKKIKYRKNKKKELSYNTYWFERIKYEMNRFWLKLLAI